MFIILLLTGFLCVAAFKEYDYNGLNIKLYVDKCDKAGLGNGLHVIDVCIIQIDNDTGRETTKVCNVHCTKAEYFRRWKHYRWSVRWKWEGRNVTIALLVMRQDKKDKNGKIIEYSRRNENPVAFYSTKYKNCKTSETGTGDDFSEMYYENPFRPGKISVTLDKSGKTVATLLNFVPQEDCYATDTWIANEGWYVLDKEKRTWYPIYFDPHAGQAFFF